jgi:hypothetical protein
LITVVGNRDQHTVQPGNVRGEHIENVRLGVLSEGEKIAICE